MCVGLYAPAASARTAAESLIDTRPEAVQRWCIDNAYEFIALPLNTPLPAFDDLTESERGLLADAEGNSADDDNDDDDAGGDGARAVDRGGHGALEASADDGSSADATVSGRAMQDDVDQADPAYSMLSGARGIARIVSSLHSNMWDGLVRKGDTAVRACALASSRMRTVDDSADSSDPEEDGECGMWHAMERSDAEDKDEDDDDDDATAGTRGTVPGETERPAEMGEVDQTAPPGAEAQMLPADLRVALETFVCSVQSFKAANESAGEAGVRNFDAALTSLTHLQRTLPRALAAAVRAPDEARCCGRHSGRAQSARRRYETRSAGRLQNRSP